MANKLENFVIALASMDVAVMLRIERFSSAFFTVIKASDVIHGIVHWGGGYTPVALQQEIQSLTNPVPPFGSAIVGDVEDLQAQTFVKVQHAQQAVSTTMDLLALDLLEASFWMDVRAAQNRLRQFGAAPTAVWRALREEVPLRPDPTALAAKSAASIAAAFVRSNDPTVFHSSPLPRLEDAAALTAADRCKVSPRGSR